MASRLPVEAPEGTAARPMTPDSSRTSASTVGLPRESRISRATTSTIELIFFPLCSRYFARALGGDALFGEAPAFHGTVNFQQSLEQFAHQAERPRVRSVRQGFFRIRVRFHEDSSYPRRDRGACE